MTTGTALGSTAHADLVQRYAAWEAKLCENIATLAQQRTMWHRIFFGGLVVSLLGFFFGYWFGVGSIVTGVVWCGTGLYLTIMRGKHYREELGRTREELRRLGAER